MQSPQIRATLIIATDLKRTIHPSIRGRAEWLQRFATNLAANAPPSNRPNRIRLKRLTTAQPRQPLGTIFSMRDSITRTRVVILLGLQEVRIEVSKLADIDVKHVYKPRYVKATNSTSLSAPYDIGYRDLVMWASRLMYEPTIYSNDGFERIRVSRNDYSRTEHIFCAAKIEHVLLLSDTQTEITTVNSSGIRTIHTVLSSQVSGLYPVVGHYFIYRGPTKYDDFTMEAEVVADSDFQRFYTYVD